MNFKHYLSTFICETLELKNDKVIYYKQAKPYSSEKGLISTYFRAKDSYLNKAGKDFNGETVYSLFNYKSDAESHDIISSLKGLGPYKLTEGTYERFLADAAKYASDIISNQEINCVIYPTSTSKFLADFIEQLKDKLDDKVIFIKDAIAKKQFKEIEAEAEHLINPDYYGISKLTASKKLSLIKQIINNVKSNEQEGRGSIITLKNVGFKRDTHYLHKFMHAVSDSILDIENQHVLIVDDLIGSGSSFAELFRVVKEYDPKSVIGLTIFKRSGS
jgi:phosphoribosylpyrophosphate synthetase